MKISERGQITIPKPLRDRFGLHQDVEIELIPSENGIIIQKRTLHKHPVDKVFGVLNKPSSTDAYMETIRGR